MTPVLPYLIRRGEDGRRGELLLRMRDKPLAYVVHLSPEQARILAVEMSGLASDHWPMHNLAARVAESLHAEISHVVIKRSGKGNGVVGFLGLVKAAGLYNIQVDATAGLATAIHMGIPIFMDGEFPAAETDAVEHTHSVHEFMTDQEAEVEPKGRGTGAAPGGEKPAPRAFLDLVDGLEFPEPGNS